MATIEQKLAHTETDIALSEFMDKFEYEENVKFSVQLPPDPFDLPAYLHMPVQDVLMELLSFIHNLRGEGWLTLGNALEEKSGDGYNGYVYAKKGSLELGAAGFAHVKNAYEKNERIILEGTFYGHKKEEAQQAYSRLIELLKPKLKAKKLKPAKEYIWQRIK